VTLLIFVVVTAAVLAIAAAAVGRAARRLAVQEPASLFEFDEAVEFIATALPGDVSSRLSYGDVRTVVAAHLAELGRQEGAGEDTVFGDGELEDRVVARADVQARELSSAEVGAILRAEADYLEAIGAVGEAVEEPAPASRRSPPEPPGVDGRDDHRS
jgi:hypothetical protein